MLTKISQGINPFFITILAALLLEYSLNLVANILNLRALKLEIPPFLQGIYKPEDYQRAQEYTRVTTCFSILVSSFHLVILLGFWLAGGFNYLDRLIRSWGFSQILDGLLYIGILFLVNGLLTLPASIYAIFVLEQRFGFNRTTPRLFVIDGLKSFGLAVLIGAPLLAGLLALFDYGGSFAWLFCWVAVVAVSLLIQIIVPTWIMPLFNKFTRVESGELKDAILNYGSSVRFPIKNVFIMDSSRRSTKSNAFFTGFGRNKRVVLFDTLVQKHTIPELVAVVAHEVGHDKHRHMIQAMLISILHAFILLALLANFINSPGLYQAFFMNQPSIYTGLLFFGLLYTPLEFLFSLSMQVISRHNESEADLFAVRTVPDPQNMVEALKKLHAENYSNLTPHPLYVFLNYSHPPLLQRVEAIQQYVKTRSAPLY